MLIQIRRSCFIVIYIVYYIISLFLALILHILRLVFLIARNNQLVVNLRVVYKKKKNLLGQRRGYIIRVPTSTPPARARHWRFLIYHYGERAVAHFCTQTLLSEFHAKYVPVFKRVAGFYVLAKFAYYSVL